MPILHSNLETDLRLANGLDAALNVTLTDMATIRSTGAVTFMGTVNGSLSDTAGIRYASLGGADHFADAAAETTDTAETGLTDTSVTIAVVRSVLTRNVGDLAVGTGTSGDISPATLAADMAASYEGYFNGIVATAIATVATDVGTSTVDASIDDFYDGLIQLEGNSNTGELWAMLHPQQLADLRTSLRAEGGAIQFNTATQAMISAFGIGFVGSFLGVNIFKSSDVSAAGGNRHGAMWAGATAGNPGALGYKTMAPDPRSFHGAGTVVTSSIPQVGLVVEITRNASQAMTQITGNAFSGVSLLDDNQIVGFVTDQ